MNPLIDLPCFSVYILIFHGSSDQRSRLASEALTSLFRDRVSVLFQDLPLVYNAYLECHPLLLHQQIEQIVQISQAKEPFKKISLQLLPVFLLAGVHLLEDIPAEIAQAQQLVGDKATLNVTAHLGSHLGLRQLLNDRISFLPMEAWILLAHGSRRLNANQPIAALADDLGATVAYWSTSPKLESCLQDLANSGYKNIGILPYFLFHGGITDAIAQSITQSQQHSTLKITLAEPLDASPGLVDLLVDLATQ